MTTAPAHTLRRHLIARGHAALAAGRGRFPAGMSRDQALAASAEVRRVFAAYYGDLREVLAATPLQARRVGGGTGEGFHWENVLFTSHPGWDVNATLFLPSDRPPPYLPLVVSVGHSGKHLPNYQRPCQYFARAGFAAVVFDPPGMVGEKQPGNDHFADGVRCHLTGDTSSRYFVGDTLRVMDYLATRADIDARHGFVLTGVSGGGNSSVFAALLDDRATLFAPSCCLNPQGSLVLDLAYASCPETLMPGRFRDGLDDVDLLRGLTPRPLLLMAGVEDEVLRIAGKRTIARETAAHYATADAAGRFAFLEDPAGHAYTLAQARSLVDFIHQQWGLADPGPRPSTEEAAYPLLTREQLACGPDTAVHMRSLTLARAAALAPRRRRPPPALLREFLGLDETTPVPSARWSGEPTRTWMHAWREVAVETEAGIVVPLTLAEAGEEAPCLWHLDDGGRWRLLARGGPLTTVIGTPRSRRPAGHAPDHGPARLGRNRHGPGTLRNRILGGPDRFAAYVGTALGDAPAAMRVRDAWQVTRALPPPRARPVLSACGAAGPVALHLAALLPGRFAAVVLCDAPATYEALLTTAEFTWPHDVVLPGALRHYDLPDLAAAAACPVRVFNPRDGAGQVVGGTQPEDEAAWIECLRSLLYG
jgi:dienelactone hydrolase